MKIRPVEASDYPAIQAIDTYYIENTVYSFAYESPSLEDIKEKVEKIKQNFPFLVAEEEGEILGYAYANSFRSYPAYDWAAETTVYLSPSAGGMGIGSHLYEALNEILIQQNIELLVAIVEINNHASRKFHEKQGFENQGEMPVIAFKNDQWQGIVYYLKRLQGSNKPANFIPYSDL